MKLPMKPLVIRTIEGEKIDRFPVWMMRQAGRYMPEYRALKERYSFSELCLNSELSVEVAMQPIKAFDFDAAILFSDIMIPARALGFDITFAPGPVVGNPIRSVDDIEALPVTSDLEPLTPVFEAVKLLKEQIADRALFGFAATPWTLACYLIDQKPFKHFERSTIWLNQRPRELHLLLEKLTELTVAYTLEQVKAGADIIQLFDSWGGILPKASYDEFSLNYSNKVFKALKLTNAKTILYINGASHLTENLGRSLADGFGIDSRATLSDFEKAFSNKTLQGNLDPSVLFGSSVREDTIRLLSGLYRKTQFILNLGHGVLQETPHGAVRDFVAAAKEFKL
jgi:uroporphyrinogen decarboxylase